MSLIRDAHAIFWEFIRSDGNALLHEFYLNAGQSVRVEVSGFQMLVLGPGTQPLQEPAPQGTKATIYYENKTGRFEDRTPLELIAEGIEWWQEQIELIEREPSRRAKRLPPAPPFFRLLAGASNHDYDEYRLGKTHGR